MESGFGFKDNRVRLSLSQDNLSRDLLGRVFFSPSMQRRCFNVMRKRKRQSGYVTVKRGEKLERQDLRMRRHLREISLLMNTRKLSECRQRFPINNLQMKVWLSIRMKTDPLDRRRFSSNHMRIKDMWRLPPKKKFDSNPFLQPLC